MERYSRLWKRRLSMSRCQSFSVNTLMYRFNAISDKIPASYFVHIGKVILVYMERHEIQNSQHHIEGEEQKCMLHNLKTY